jgi:uncharacterized protein YkwD
VEGARIDLPVTASDPDGDLAEVRVDWGDGTVAGTTHRYRDDGTYSVRVTALDEQGNVATSEPLTLTVVGAAPDIDLVAGELVAGAAGTVELAAADPAQNDRPLELTVTSVPAGAASYTGAIDGGRTLRVQPPAGTTSLDVTVKVTDNDGLGTTVTRTFPVVASPGAPPTAPANVVASPAPACASGTSGIALRAQAADFLGQANTFRASFGAPTLVVSKELQLAAEQQLADLTAKRYFAHLDSAGRTPLDRARANGYTGGVGENIALRFVNGAQVLLGWRSSPVHLENLLDRAWPSATRPTACSGSRCSAPCPRAPRPTGHRCRAPWCSPTPPPTPPRRSPGGRRSLLRPLPTRRPWPPASPCRQSPRLPGSRWWHRRRRWPRSP